MTKIRGRIVASLKSIQKKRHKNFGNPLVYSVRDTKVSFFVLNPPLKHYKNGSLQPFGILWMILYGKKWPIKKRKYSKIYFPTDDNV